MPLGKYGAKPSGKFAAAVKILEQGFPPSTSGGADTVEFRVKRIGQLLRAPLIASTRCTQDRASCRTQLIPEMSDEKLPCFLQAVTAGAGQCQILQVQRFQVSLNGRGICACAPKPFLGTSSQGLRKALGR